MTFYGILLVYLMIVGIGLLVQVTKLFTSKKIKKDFSVLNQSVLNRVPLLEEDQATEPDV